MPMDRSEIQRIVDRDLPRWIERLKLRHWKIKVDVRDDDGEQHAATCWRDTQYQMAKILIQPRYAIDAVDVSNSLKHEMVHILLAPFDLYRHYFVQGNVSGTKKDQKENMLWSFSIEPTVLSVMRAIPDLTVIEES